MTRPYKRRTPDPDAAALLAAIAAKCALCAARVPLRGDVHRFSLRERESSCAALAERAALRELERKRRAARSAAFTESLVSRPDEKQDESMLERVRSTGGLFATTPAESRSLERLRRARLVKYQNWRRNPDWRLNFYVLSERQK